MEGVCSRFLSCYLFISAGDTTQFLLHVTGQVSREGFDDIIGCLHGCSCSFQLRKLS